jgi:hypothetical protein
MNSKSPVSPSVVTLGTLKGRRDLPGRLDARLKRRRPPLSAYVPPTLLDAEEIVRVHHRRGAGPGFTMRYRSRIRPLDFKTLPRKTDDEVFRSEKTAVDDYL